VVRTLREQAGGGTLRKLSEVVAYISSLERLELESPYPPGMLLILEYSQRRSYLVYETHERDLKLRGKSMQVLPFSELVNELQEKALALHPMQQKALQAA
jgi:hypothetical protein